jgi:hypothetical protein
VDGLFRQREEAEKRRIAIQLKSRERRWLNDQDDEDSYNRHNVARFGYDSLAEKRPEPRFVAPRRAPAAEVIEIDLVEAPGGSPDRVYLLQQGDWEARWSSWGGVWLVPDTPHGESRWRMVPQMAFVDRGQSQQFLDEAEQQAHRLVCPSWLVHFPSDASSLDAKTFLRQVQELGLSPPPPSAAVFHDWRTWIVAIMEDSSDQQRLGFWKLLDKVRFFQLAEVPLA